jgi:hypothetical protein
MKTSVIVALACAVALSGTPVGAQAPATLEVRGASGQQRVLSMEDLAKLPRREVSASAHNVSGRFSGVPLADLLALVGAPGGDSLRGAALASYVLVEAADGYRIVFAIAETSPSFTDKVILLADYKDGAALSARDGPFQLVVPDEKRPARWVRQVTRISIVRLP